MEPSLSLQSTLVTFVELALAATVPVPIGVQLADIHDLGQRLVAGTASEEAVSSVVVQAAVEWREEMDRAVFATLEMHALPDSAWASAIASAGSRFLGLDGKGSGEPFASRIYYLTQEVQAARVVAPVSKASLLADEKAFTANHPVVVKGGCVLAGVKAWELEISKLFLAMSNAGIPSSLMAGKVELFIAALPPSEFKTTVVEATRSWELLEHEVDMDGKFRLFRVFASKLDERVARSSAGAKSGGVSAAAGAVAPVKAAGAAAAAAKTKAETAAKTAPLRANAAVAAICFNCGEKGHMSRECGLPQAGLRCYTCKEVGHRSKDCPKRVPSAGAGNE